MDCYHTSTYNWKPCASRCVSFQHLSSRCNYCLSHLVSCAPWQKDDLGFEFRLDFLRFSLRFCSSVWHPADVAPIQQVVKAASLEVQNSAAEKSSLITAAMKDEGQVSVTPRLQPKVLESLRACILHQRMLLRGD